MSSATQSPPTAGGGCVEVAAAPGDHGLWLYVGRDPVRACIVVTVVGRLDGWTQPRLFGLLRHLQEQEKRAWVDLDFTDVTVEAGVGAAELAACQRQFSDAGGRLSVRGATGRGQGLLRGVQTP